MIPYRHLNITPWQRSYSMRLIGYDVGIKNLAYCIVDVPEDDPEAFTILDWDIINIIGGDHRCGVSGCPLSGSYEVGPERICVLHKDERHQQLQTAAREATAAALDSSITAKKREAALAAAARSVKLTKSASKVADVSADELRLSLVRCLDARPALLDAAEVVIENQPTLKNPRMKAVSDTLYTWYVIRGMVDAQRPIGKISFVAPASKLRGVDKEKIEGATNERDKYKQTKQLAISYSKKLLSKDESRKRWADLLERHDKQDDMCDAFLHALQYARLLHVKNKPKKGRKATQSK